MTSKPVILVGGGGHARVLLDALLLGSRQVLGIVDADPSKLPAAVRGVPVLGNDDVLQTHGPERVELVLGIGSVAPGSLRERVYLRYRQLGYAFAAVVHPSAVIARDATLASDVQVMAGVVVQTASQIGPNVILNTGCRVDHDCELAQHVHVSPGATLCGDVRVGAGSHVGAGATLTQGVVVGAGVFIYAGAVVTRDLAAGLRVAGVPAREVKP